MMKYLNSEEKYWRVRKSMGPRKKFRFEKNQIITNTKFIVDTIMPLSIGLAGDNVYFILFKIIQSCTEEELFIHFPIEISNDGEKSFFDNHSLNLNNVLKNDKMKEFFKEETRNMNSNKIYMTDFVMRRDNRNKHWKIFSINIKFNSTILI